MRKAYPMLKGWLPPPVDESNWNDALKGGVTAIWMVKGFDDACGTARPVCDG